MSLSDAHGDGEYTGDGLSLSATVNADNAAQPQTTVFSYTLEHARTPALQVIHRRLMPAAGIDTNVLLVANGSHAGASRGCREECVKRLLAQQREGVTVIDDGYRILQEYQHKTRPNQPKEVGDAFLKWLLQNQGDTARVH
ncbi:MAG TPA: hypothetical protein VFL86_11630 [Burkholderiaceae bacterium]|nr:hypothetical protein [Burkholderiaceae bacterium]